MNRQGKVGEQVVRQPPTNENCLIKKGMLRVHHSYKLSFVRQRGLWDILKVRRSLCKKRHPEQLAVCVNAHECVMRGHISSIPQKWRCPSYDLPRPAKRTFGNR